MQQLSFRMKVPEVQLWHAMDDMNNKKGIILIYCSYRELQ